MKMLKKILGGLISARLPMKNKPTFLKTACKQT